MGLHIDVYRSADRSGDCTAGGISGRHPELCIVNVNGPSDPTDKAPAALLVPGNLPGTLKIVGAVKNEAGDYVPLTYPNATGPMMGGNYGATSDSRFSEACERLLGHRFYGAVPIHDRFEY
jgi:hypothetical protein